MNYTIDNGRYVFLYSLKNEEDVRLDLSPISFPEMPESVVNSAKKVNFFSDYIVLFGL